GIEDPKISTAYTYEFADTPIPAVIQGGSSRTMKEWKRRQMGLVGSKVPMVRCHNHGRVLNLSFDGRIFDSEGGWEAELKDEVDCDTRGLIQLSSRTLGHPRFAPFVKNIKVEQKASRIHFLMGTGWSTSEGSLVASFVMHYANGEQQQFNVLYGIHVLDWVS